MVDQVERWNQNLNLENKKFKNLKIKNKFFFWKSKLYIYYKTNRV